MIQKGRQVEELLQSLEELKISNESGQGEECGEVKRQMIDYLFLHHGMIEQIMKENEQELDSRVLMNQIFANEGPKEIKEYLLSLKSKFQYHDRLSQSERDKKKVTQYELWTDMMKLDELLLQFHDLTHNMIAKYNARVDQTKFERDLFKIYGSNTDRLVRDIITSRAYEDSSSKFFWKLPTSTILYSKTPSRFIKDFMKILEGDMQDAMVILGCINELQGKKEIIQNSLRKVYLLVKFSIQAKKFMQEYRRKFKDDFLLKILRTRYINNEGKLVRDLINYRVFTDPKFQFLDQFPFHENITAQIKSELIEQSSYCIRKLEECMTIFNSMM